MIVMKFGGTSTQDAAAMRNVARIVKGHLDRQPVVTISAIAQATNMLEQAGKEAADGRERQALDVVSALASRHAAIAEELIGDRARRQEMHAAIITSRAELEELVRGVTILRELTPRTLDAFYCHGELLSSRLVAAALREDGIPSAWLDTAEFMVTDDHFTRAMPLMDVVSDRLRKIALPLLADRTVPVTQGFIGVTAGGRRTTMGRESSDYSAAIIGAALGADDIQIWTDVDGVLTADPRAVPSPRKIKTLSFEEAYELSYFGAKVLHPNTMLPAIEKNIPIRIVNSRKPGRSGTVVVAGTSSTEPVVKSVASRRNLTMVSILPHKRHGQYLLWEHVLGVLTKYGAPAEMTVTSEYKYSFVLNADADVWAIANELGEVGAVETHPGCGIVCIVGSGIRGASHVVDRLFRALAGCGIMMISFGASQTSLSVVLPDTAIPEAVKNVHREFFEDGIDPANFEKLDEASSRG